MVFKQKNKLWKLRKTHKCNEKTKIKISETLKNKGIKPPSPLGIIRSEETKRKMRISAQKSKNKGRFNKGCIPWNKGKTKENNTSLKKLANNRKNNKNPNWAGGTSFEPYGSEFKETRKKILKRDLFTCQECHRHQNELKRSLEVHHIDFNKKNNIPENLISLCKSCHHKTLHGKDEWIGYYQDKINENLGGMI